MKRAIDFLITQKCNYRCDYCSQSKKFAKGALESATEETIKAFLKFLSKLDTGVEVTISGGEPFCHPSFFYLTEEIVKLRHGLFVVSNFSYPFESYKKLKDLAGEKLFGLLVSLHSGQVQNIEEFLIKAENFNAIKGGTDFRVASVLSDGNCETLKGVYNRLNAANIPFELQHMRIGNKFVEYGKDAARFIKDFPISAIKEKSHTFGYACRAGRDFMLVYQNGECYRCYSSRFNRVHSMGNIKDEGFKMYKTALPCLNKNCTCPKPIELGLIDYDDKKPCTAVLLSTYNALWLPYYCVKNFKVLRAKFSQLGKFKKQG